MAAEVWRPVDQKRLNKTSWEILYQTVLSSLPLRNNQPGTLVKAVVLNVTLPNLPTLSLSHRVHKTVLYISVSFAISYTRLLLPSF